MSNIYLTSDLHIGHDKEFLYKPRGFNNIQEHDDCIINNINSIVKEDDILYILGDIAMGNVNYSIEYLKQITCKKKYFIIGNHDGSTKIPRYNEINFISLGYAYYLKYHKFNFILSHYPTLTVNVDDSDKPLNSRTWNICGHSHQKECWDNITNSYHVELDAHNNFPISIEQIVFDIKNKF